jgi:hypothetical protein
MQQERHDNVTYFESVGIRALGFLSSRPMDFARFLATTGRAPEDFTRAPYGHDQLAAALEFLVTNEATLQGFTQLTSRSPETIYDARRIMCQAATLGDVPTASGGKPWRAMQRA